ncbi:MAG TPA: hypothetical protein VM658_00350 [bacterium]|nr:hypothetical protein [bacterium]
MKKRNRMVGGMSGVLLMLLFASALAPARAQDGDGPEAQPQVMFFLPLGGDTEFSKELQGPWSGRPAVTRITTRDHVFHQPDKWQGAQDLFFQTIVQKDDHNIRFDVKVNDDVMVTGKDIKDLWRDHVELWLGLSSQPEPEQYPIEDYNAPELERVVQLGLVPDAGNSVSVKLWKDYNANDKSAVPKKQRLPELAKARARLQKTSSGYLITFTMPQPAAGKIYYSRVCVSDDDDPAAPSQKTLMCTSSDPLPLVFYRGPTDPPAGPADLFDTRPERHITKVRKISADEFKGLKKKMVMLARKDGPGDAQFLLMAKPSTVKAGLKDVDWNGERLPVSRFAFPDMDAISLVYRIGPNHYAGDFDGDGESAACLINKPGQPVKCLMGMDYVLETCSLGPGRILVKYENSIDWGGSPVKLASYFWAYIAQGDTAVLFPLMENVDVSDGGFSTAGGSNIQADFSTRDLDGDGRKEIVYKLQSSYWEHSPFHVSKKMEALDQNGKDITAAMQWAPEIFSPLCRAPETGAAGAKWQYPPILDRSARSAVSWHPEAWQGPKDLSFQLQSCTDEAYLYFRVQARDNAVIAAPAMKDVVRDHVELWLNFVGSYAFPSSTYENLYSGYVYPESELQIGIVPLGEGKARSEVWSSDEERDEDTPLDLLWTMDMRRVKAEYQRTDDGYVMTVAVPLPLAGVLDGAVVCVSDTDDPKATAQKTMMCTTPSRPGRLVYGGGETSAR